MNKVKSALDEYKSLLPYFAKYRRHYILGLVCLVAVDAAQILIPQFLRRAVDLISSGVFQWKEIIVLAIWMTVIMAFISGGRFLWRYFIHGSSRRIETALREELFNHLQTLSWDFYQKNKTGDLMSRSINDLNAVHMAIGMGLVALVDSVLMTTAILIIIFVQDARSAFFSVLPLPFITLIILIFGGFVGKKFQRAQETYSAMSDTVQETFAGIRVIKSFVKEWWFIKKFADTNDDYRKANMDLVRLFGFFFPFVTFLSELTVLVMLIVGGLRVIQGLMSPGSLVAMFRYLTMMIWPLMGAGFMVNIIQRGAVSLKRVNEVLNTVPSIRDTEHAAGPPPDIAGRAGVTAGADNNPAVEVSGLSFSYNGTENVLENINFIINRGEWIGIMGRTGSGKSTLVKILTRMVDPPAAAVKVFGLDVREWPLAGLRSLFAASPQDSYLFSDSIQNNIGYGLDNPAPEALQKAITLAALGKDLENFSGGRETLIGERGLTLSGGQKQRTAIARSVIMDSEFLVLDDSLSAVDAETERNILEALLRERKDKSAGCGRTTIFISHRVSTLRYADKVLVLDRGKIIERGSPAELAASGGFYSRMAALQRLDQSPFPNPGEREERHV
ncbi:MAG: ABC transporter ATP-binding protein/permease [Treponema sp.]|jgi:ATP-binding cassette subfamily B protein|nr:ABC transporter ATP-binding protein/permease [Treponema sp.]